MNEKTQSLTLRIVLIATAVSAIGLAVASPEFLRDDSGSLPLWAQAACLIIIAMIWGTVALSWRRSRR